MNINIIRDGEPLILRLDTTIVSTLKSHTTLDVFFQEPELKISSSYVTLYDDEIRSRFVRYKLEINHTLDSNYIVEFWFDSTNKIFAKNAIETGISKWIGNYATLCSRDGFLSKDYLEFFHKILTRNIIML